MDKPYNAIKESITSFVMEKFHMWIYQSCFVMKPYNININYVDPDAYYNNLDQGDKCVN